ncbi:GntR family transcriptional regulator, partial [Kineococcus glutinatus]|uniref:GntR family transcriptional regulator n=1 Tax=Kineococcus glutinatus TaxID=1070872 RepID=UPI0031F196B1
MPAQDATAARTAAGIAADLERAVTTGALPPGTALPSVRALAAEHVVDPGTAAAAYRTLRERGVV